MTGVTAAAACEPNLNPKTQSPEKAIAFTLDGTLVLELEAVGKGEVDTSSANDEARLKTGSGGLVTMHPKHAAA